MSGGSLSGTHTGDSGTIQAVAGGASSEPSLADIMGALMHELKTEISEVRQAVTREVQQVRIQQCEMLAEW